MPIDFDLLDHDAAYTWSFLQAQKIEGRPHSIWRPVPPGVSGLKHALLAVKIGDPLEHWFSSNRLSWSPQMLKSALFTNVAVAASRMVMRPVARPRYVPLDAAGPIVDWLTETVRRGNPGTLSLPANSAVRVCLEARRRQAEISGTMFQVSGEPLTLHKWRIMDSMGVRTSSSWAMAEAGRLANGCAAREVIDEVHVLTDKVAIVEKSAPLLLAEGDVKSLFLTTLLPATTKVMLNVDTGDCGVLNERKCGCALEESGYGLHLHTIRNYEKLTAGGMHFTGSDVLELIDSVLPTAHGGAPTDYQLVEQQGGALTKIGIVVSPRVGEVENQAVIATVLDFLGGKERGGRMMADHWKDGGTLLVIRREPYATGAGKVPPIRIETHPSGDGIQAGSDGAGS